MKRYEQRLSISKRQRGIVLLITLLVLVAMMLVSVGMMRSVDTSVAAVGNIAFRQAADATVNTAVESVLRGMVNNCTGAAVLDTDNISSSCMNVQCVKYYASIQAGESAQGIPSSLLTPWSSCTANGSGNTVQTVVERMCNAAGPAGTANCSVAGAVTGAGRRDAPNKSNQRGFGGGASVATGTPMIFYRVSVRVDGPNNTVSFAQAIIGF
ncbi:MAG: hypothetical protein FWC42_04890 [Proteobacteria bacterium]|nr:hypothetical protein [Pseudomonadota bacterium]